MANEVKHSDIVFLNLKQTKKNKPESVYVISSSTRTRTLILGQKAWTEMAYAWRDAKTVMFYRPYLVAAVKRYFRDNAHCIPLQCLHLLCNTLQ